jgi:hypothetical protein
MKLNVEDFEELEIVVPHDCGKSKEPYAAVEGRHDQGQLFLLECENCGEKIGVGLGHDKLELIEQVTAWSEHQQTEEERSKSADFRIEQEA